MSDQLTGTARTPAMTVAPPSVAAHVAVGSVFGLGWAAGLRGYMAEIAGAESTFSWGGTFLALLLPATVTGALLGWAEYLRRTGGRRHLRLLVLAPLVIAVAPMLMPGALVGLVTAGLGGGAIAFAVIGVGGGFALSGQGRAGWRILCGVVVLLLIVGIAATPAGIGGPDLAISSPRGAWVAVIGLASGLTLAVAGSIPLRRVLPGSAVRPAEVSGEASPAAATS